MRGFFGKLLIVALLTLSAAVWMAEFSGRWDQSIQDANDEAALVAIVLCIGLAISVAGTALLPLQSSRPTLRVPALIAVGVQRAATFRAIPLSASGPPIPLRV